jgi:hypothetical protein
MGEVIGVGRAQPEEKKERFYSMTIGIKEYLCQIIDEDEHLKFEKADSKTHREQIKSFEPKSAFIRIKNVVWLLPTPNGDAPIDYETLSTGSDEVVVNVSAIQKLNLLPDRVSAEIAQEKKAARLGLVSSNEAAAAVAGGALPTRKGGPNGR